MKFSTIIGSVLVVTIIIVATPAKPVSHHHQTANTSVTQPITVVAKDDLVIQKIRNRQLLPPLLFPHNSKIAKITFSKDQLHPSYDTVEYEVDSPLDWNNTIKFYKTEYCHDHMIYKGIHSSPNFVDTDFLFFLHPKISNQFYRYTWIISSPTKSVPKSGKKNITITVLTDLLPTKQIDRKSQLSH